MSNITKYVRDAFKSLDLLEDTSFDLSSKDDIKELGDFINDDGDIDPDAGQVVFDTEAETEDDLKTSYVGDVILCCPVCQAVHFDDFETVKEKHDEETDVYCVGEPCPVCGNEDGFEAIGEVKKFDPDFSEEEDEVKFDAEGDDIDVEVKEKEEVREALRRKTAKRIAEKYSRGGKTIFRRDLNESKRNRKSLVKENEGVETRDVTDKVIVKKSEPGFISKMRELRAQGYECTGAGDGQMIFTKPKVLRTESKRIRESVSDWTTEDIQREIERIVEERFKGTDFWATVEEVNFDDGFLTLDIRALDNDEELSRTVVFKIPRLDIENDLGDQLDNWMADHDSPDNFYEDKKSVRKGKKLKESTVMGVDIDDEALQSYVNSLSEGDNITVTADLLGVLESSLEIIKKSTRKTSPSKGTSYSGKLRLTNLSDVPLAVSNEFDRIGLENDILDCTTPDEVLEAARKNNKYLKNLRIHKDNRSFTVISGVDSFGNQHFLIAYKEGTNESKRDHKGKKLTEVRNTTEADAEEFLESTIKVYDIASFIRSETDNKYTTHMADKYALIPTKKGNSFVFEDYEAVGELVKAGGKVKVDVEEYKEDSNTIQIFPSGYVEITTDEILALPAQEMKAKDFFTKWNYNSRCERNFTEMIEAIYGVGRLANESKEIGRGKRRNKLTEAPVYELRPQYDSRQSFYGKAQVDTGDKNDKNKLYSYDTLVAEIKDGKPVVYGTYSQTTLRHIKDWLKQNGFKAENSKQIINDYGVKEECKESVGKREVHKLYESKGDLDKLDEEVRDIVGEVFDYTMDFDFLDIVADILLRTDDYEASAENIDIVLDDLDSGLIYADDQWEVLRYYFDSPGDLDSESWNDAFTHFAEDIQRVCSAIVENKEIKADFEEEEEVEESFSKKSGKKIKESSKDFDDEPEKKENKPMSFAEFKKHQPTEDGISTGLSDEELKKEYDEYLKDFKGGIKESIESATIETEDQVINVSSEDKEENMLDDFDPDFSNFDEVEEGGDEMIAPLSDEEVADLENGSEEEEETSEEEFPEDEEAEEEVDGIQEESFNRLVNNYLKKTYNNVESFKRTDVGTTGKQLRLEGVITFKSGKTKNTSFIFERVADKRTISKKSVRFVGMNETFTDKKNAFVLRAKLNNKKLVAESLRYEYPVKSSKLNEDVKIVKGLVK